MYTLFSVQPQPDAAAHDAHDAMQMFVTGHAVQKALRGATPGCTPINDQTFIIDPLMLVRTLVDFQAAADKAGVVSVLMSFDAPPVVTTTRPRVKGA